MSLVYSEVNVDDADFRTVLLHNVGPNPILYNFDSEPSGFVFIYLL